MKHCTHCHSEFTVTVSDRAFLEKVSPVFGAKKYLIPEPTLCPACREQKRLAWRNEWSLYPRQCDLTGKKIISYISPDKPIVVYNLEDWYSDKWDARDFGMEFDFNRPFFEQFRELMEKVPHIPLLIGDCENCEYTNYSLGNKNCYLISAADWNEDSYYACYLMRSKNCIDCLFVVDSELCYECVDCEKCYETCFSQNCQNCRNLYFSESCKSCHDCIACINLFEQSYCIFNKKYSQEEFEKQKEELLQNPSFIKQQFSVLKRREPHKYAHILNSEKCSGDYIMNCKNCQHCFDMIDSEDCNYVTYGIKAKDCRDMNGSASNELCYETCANPDCYHAMFSSGSWVQSSNLTYCHICRATHNCFGCISLYRNEYCILNKQYSKEEYEELVPQIIDHMTNTGEWGQFFSASISPFAYNETIAQEIYPLEKKEVLNKGWQWKEKEEKKLNVERIIPAEKLPNEISKIPDDVLNWAIECEETKVPFKIIPQELAFYRKLNLPLPHFHPDERHKRRLKLRSPHELYDRTCDKCGKEIQSPFALDGGEKVYCEECYLNELY
jgi:CxxC-x17-CxxC domain-containing protein